MGILLLGVLILAVAVVRPMVSEGPDLSRETGNTPAVVQIRDERPSRLWALAGGASMAVGAGLVGLGMNRWRQHGNTVS